MKKLLIVGSSLMLLSSAAFASKARLMALGEDKDGSYYVQDFRNIYINPAHLNTTGNLATIELGAAGQAFGGASLDSDSATKAQGGVVYGLNDTLTLGLVLGDESDVAALTRMLSSNGGTYAVAGEKEFIQTADNVIDVFLAGKGNVNWGVNLLYTSSKDETTGTNKHKQHSYAARAGVQKDNWDAHLLLALGAEGDAPNRSVAPKYEGKLGLRVGGTYALNDSGKAFGMYEQYSWEQSRTGLAVRDGSFNKWFAGYGHTTKVSEKSTFFAKTTVEAVSIKLDSVASTAEAKIDRLAVPLVLGFEHATTEWLTLRGSIVQNLFGTVKDSGLTANFGTASASSPVAASTTGEIIRYLAAAKYGSSLSGNGGKKTIANSTAVNAGASLTFGNFAIDGLIGTSIANRSPGATTATVNSGSTGNLTLDNLESRVSMTYKF